MGMSLMMKKRRILRITYRHVSSPNDGIRYSGVECRNPDELNCPMEEISYRQCIIDKAYDASPCSTV
jgi:hypothetical protein